MNEPGVHSPSSDDTAMTIPAGKTLARAMGGYHDGSRSNSIATTAASTGSSSEIVDERRLGARAPPTQPNKKKRRKPSEGNDAKTGHRDGGEGCGGMDTATRKKKRLLAEAAKNSSSGDAKNSSGALTSFLELVTSAQAVEIFKSSPPSSFVGELLAHLVRLLPLALASADGAASFIECLQPFESLEEFVLPATFYRAVASAAEPPLPSPRGHTWRRKKDRPLEGVTGAAGSSYSESEATVTGLETLREYLCMNGKDSLDCDRRTVVTTLTRALLGSWDGSETMGRELFDQSVLKSPDRSGPVGLGLEILLQSLVQEDVIFCGVDEKEITQHGDEDAYTDEEESGRSRDSEGGGSEAASQSTARHDRRRSHRRPLAGNGTSALASSEETNACVTIIGNYVRADPDTAGSFFRDILPKVLLMGNAGGGRGRGVSLRVPRRLAAVLRSLVDSTRARNSFNMERMVIHTVKTVKGWNDPEYALSSASAIDLSDDVDDDIAKDEETVRADIASGRKGRMRGKGSYNANEKLRRRGLVLACLDTLGPTPSCMSVIRREMVDGESKPSLRSAVIDALLEYRRTCDMACADDMQGLVLSVLCPLAEDGTVGVRLSALAAVGEACSSDCVPAMSLLLKRCLDTSPKARRLAARLLVDEFKLGIGNEGASLARAVLSWPDPGQRSICPPRGSTNGSSTGYGGGRDGKASRAPSGGGGGGVSRSGHSGSLLLGRLLRHKKTLEETDTERMPLLLSGLVEAVLRGDTFRSRDQPGHQGNEDSEDNDDVVLNADSPAGVIGGDARDHLLDPRWDGGGVSWEDLDAPATRLWEACRPFDPVQLGVLDRIFADLFRLR